MRAAGAAASAARPAPRARNRFIKTLLVRRMPARTAGWRNPHCISPAPRLETALYIGSMSRRRAATPRREGARARTAPLRARRKFLRFFPGGFRDETYLEWERGYKATAHERWLEALGPDEFTRLLAARRFGEIAAWAVRIESRTNLLFSFEKMALRDAVRPPGGARVFAEALGEFLYRGDGGPAAFDRWVEALAALPQRQTRVLTWPLATVFGF